MTLKKTQILERLGRLEATHLKVTQEIALLKATIENLPSEEFIEMAKVSGLACRKCGDLEELKTHKDKRYCKPCLNGILQIEQLLRMQKDMGIPEFRDLEKKIAPPEKKDFGWYEQKIVGSWPFKKR